MVDAETITGISTCGFHVHDGEIDRQDRSGSAQICRFLTLSPELRNRIYEFALVKTCSIVLTKPPHRSQSIPINRKRKGGGASWKSEMMRKTTAQPRLLQTCRQIYTEAVGIYYGCNTFASVNLKVLCAWLHVIGQEKRALLKAVESKFNIALQDNTLGASLLDLELIELCLTAARISVAKDTVRLGAFYEGMYDLLNVSEMKRHMREKDWKRYRKLAPAVMKTDAIMGHARRFPG